MMTDNRGFFEKQTEKLLTVRQVAQMLTVSIRYVWDLRKNHRLPKAIQLSNRVVRWRQTDILLWLEWKCPDEEGFEAMRNDFFGNPDCSAIRRSCSN